MRVRSPPRKTAAATRLLEDTSFAEAAARLGGGIHATRSADQVLTTLVAARGEVSDPARV